MKNYILLIAFLFSFSNCAKQETRNMLTSGDYDGVITNAVNNLKGNKYAKGKQDFIYLLEEAYSKAVDRDLREIELLFKDANPRNLEKLFNTYLRLYSRQEIIRPLLPLKLVKENRDAIFSFNNYSDEIVSSKNALSKHLYNNSKALLATKQKSNFRLAHKDLNYLNELSPNFKDVIQLIETAKMKGTNYVRVTTKNETNMVIPIRLQNELLDFRTYGLNDEWTVYHNNQVNGITYDFGIVVNFNQIMISPERVNEKEIQHEKLIKVGVKNLVNSNGVVVKDSLGNPIKIDDLKTVRIRINEFYQLKTCQVTARVDYVDLTSNNVQQTYPLRSEFVFSNTYSRFRGDKRACEQSYYPNFDRRMVPFPSNEQMVYDTGEELKNKLKAIIIRNKF